MRSLKKKQLSVQRFVKQCVISNTLLEIDNDLFVLFQSNKQNQVSSL